MELEYLTTFVIQWSSIRTEVVTRFRVVLISKMHPNSKSLTDAEAFEVTLVKMFCTSPGFIVLWVFLQRLTKNQISNIDFLIA